MYTVINMQDVTQYISPDDEENGSSQSGGINFNAALSDPNSTWDFTLDDINQTLNIQNFAPVIVFDENLPPIQGIATVPSMNFARNPTLANGTNWTTSGTLSGLITFLNNANSFKMTFNNNALGSGLASQQTLQGYVQPGIEYCWSGYVHDNLSTIVNVQAFLQITWLDISGNTIGSPVSQAWTPPTFQRFFFTATAPAGAVYALLAVGGQTTVGGNNSGNFTWGTVQFEPMWFAWDGVSYPTPDCDGAQANSVIMPDGTTSRACRLFAGYVEDQVRAYSGKQRHIAVQCAAASKLLDTMGLYSASFTSTQDTTIIADMLAAMPSNPGIIGTLATGQQNSFAPTSTLIPGTVVDSISFNDTTPKDVVNNLSGQSSSIYYVDPYYYFWYVPPSFVGTVVQLSDTPDNVTSFPYDTFSVEYDSTNPVNYCRVKGTKQSAAAITDTFSGNGSQTVFDLTEPPSNTQAVTVGGTSIRTGVDGVDNSKFGPSSTYRALINKQRQIITFATAPASGTNNVLVTYTFEDQVISDVLAADAISDQRAQFWGLVSDSAITSTNAAKNRGLVELQGYANPRTILTLSSLGIYMPVGSLILFTCQSESMSQQPFVVQTVASDLQGGGVDHWNYTAGVYNPSTIDHFRNFKKAIQKTPTTANVAVVASIDVAIFDTVSITDSVTTNHNGAPPQGPYKYGPSANAAIYGFASYS